MAPNYTARPNFSKRTLDWRAHYEDERSSRALVNAPGGVETNRANVVQVELIGTCDAKYRVSRKEWGKAGVDYLFWPDAPEWALDALAHFIADMNRRHGIPIQGPATWLNYGPDPRAPGRNPASYGQSPARFSFATWRSFYGWCGHQHVPENTHGDPITGKPVPLADAIWSVWTYVLHVRDYVLVTRDLGDTNAAQIKALSTAIAAGAAGDSVDMAAVQEAARRGVEEALAAAPALPKP